MKSNKKNNIDKSLVKKYENILGEFEKIKLYTANNPTPTLIPNPTPTNNTGITQVSTTGTTSNPYNIIQNNPFNTVSATPLITYGNNSNEKRFVSEEEQKANVRAEKVIGILENILTLIEHNYIEVVTDLTPIYRKKLDDIVGLCY